MIEPRRERTTCIDWTYTRVNTSSSGVGDGGHCEARAHSHTHTHTEERNLSLTRILNGCAEARTVGTHYSTTHPPPLSQNSTSSSCSFFSFSFSFLRLCRSRLCRVSFSLALSRSLASRAPFSPLLGGWFFRLTPPSVPLSTLLSFSQRTRVHPARHGETASRVYSYIAHVLAAFVCVCTRTYAHTYTHTRARNTLV